MPSMRSAAISSHTTASSPRPHVLYTILVTLPDAGTRRIQRRYSEVRTIAIIAGRHEILIYIAVCSPSSSPQRHILPTAEAAARHDIRPFRMGRRCTHLRAQSRAEHVSE